MALEKLYDRLLLALHPLARTVKVDPDRVDNRPVRPL